MSSLPVNSDQSASTKNVALPQFSVADVLHWTAIVAMVLGVCQLAAAIWQVPQIALIFPFAIALIVSPIFAQPPDRALWRQLRSATIWVSICWLGAAAFGIGLPPAIIIALCYTLARRWYLAAALVVLCSPFTLGFAAGVASYWQGTAALQSGPRCRFRNLDPELRCRRRSDTSCIATGFEYIREPTHDFGVRTMTKMFGYMPGAYTGPYPTEEEAQAALQMAAAVATESVMEDRLVIGEREYALDHELGGALLGDCTRWGWGTAEPHYQLTATVWREDCLILRIPLVNEPHLSVRPLGPEPALIALIARDSGRPFAYYLEGDHHRRVHPPIR